MQLSSSRWLSIACVTLWLTACAKPEVDACNDASKARARQFVSELLQQEASGARLKELAAKEGAAPFYGKVGYDRSTEPAWTVTYVRDGFTAGQANCIAKPTPTAAGQFFEVTVQFPAGQWFDRAAHGSLPAGEHAYTLRLLQGELTLTQRLPSPFISKETALKVLGAEPYAAPELLALRQQLSGTR